MNMKLALHWQICIAILLAGVAGYFGGPDWRLLGVPAYGVYEFLGTLFMNGLRMIIVPLVVSTIITGIAGAARHQDDSLLFGHFARRRADRTGAGELAAARIGRWR